MNGYRRPTPVPRACASQRTAFRDAKRVTIEARQPPPRRLVRSRARRAPPRPGRRGRAPASACHLDAVAPARGAPAVGPAVVVWVEVRVVLAARGRLDVGHD